MTKNNHLYLSDLPIKKSFNHTNYSNKLLKETTPLLSNMFIDDCSENAIPRAALQHSFYEALTYFKAQGFTASISDSQKYLITCNPFNIALQTHQNTPAIIVSPKQFIFFLCYQDNNNPIEGLFKLILFLAEDNKSTDIHIYNNETITIKQNGYNQISIPIYQSMAKRLMYYIKLIGHLDPNITFKPQDGATIFKYNEINLDVRISTIPTHQNEMISLRVFNPNNNFKDLENLGFEPNKINSIKQMINAEHGLILITGATGSGKSTTLYSLLRLLQHRHVITLEDPIEQVIPNIHQTCINPNQGYTFEVGLKAILRHNPDVIAIGEIRDKQTAEIVLNAAYSGHLVIASLHTNTIETTLLRLKNLGCSPFLISYCLRGIISQKLIQSKTKTQLSSSILQCIKPHIITDLEKDLSLFLKS
ncbi:MAG: ATPase, T2SS/T4P/T4SS family, partial [Candidatus Margulisiibacteriota bacterium]|nr:ATPase, T2SS/T4P/T4SS family [Candidatus Margulisiibacteriota bacterium]